MAKINIYCMAHKVYEVFEDDIYIPLQVGAALYDDLGYMRDDTGDNISDKNPYYSELTGLYWMYKNGEICDITGLCHYRRYFLNDNGDVLTSQDIERMLEKSDIITSQRITLSDESIYESYAKKHHAKDMDITRAVIEQLYPDYITIYDEVLNGYEMYFANMFIARKKMADEYSKWLFDILSEVEVRLDMEGYDEYNRRVYGFIAERLMMVWIRKNDYKVSECAVGLTENKAETDKALECADRMLQRGDIDGVITYLDEVQTNRPDVFYKDSDIEGNLGMLYTYATIMKAEAVAGMDNLGKYSLDYREINKLGDRLKMAVADSSQRLYDYISHNNLSVIYMLVMLPKLYEDTYELIGIYNKLASMYLDHNNIEMARIYVGEAMKLEA